MTSDVVIAGGGPTGLFGELLQDQANIQRIADLMAGANVRYPRPGQPRIRQRIH